ncbi:10401_t:CDS:2 [Ambispora gerdemannii]|uniref:10401_t:CDS:1 n=1 Tax=Ambispora gerdemannii TaxID=144530 RepID=A0A9N9HB07_9GLOM|nr:10401_t:CDS:2 [Ambispora gerdemannii]
MSSIVSESESSETTPATKKLKIGKSQSWVFKEGHFIKHDPQQMDRAQCTYCKSILKHDNKTGTSALIRHLKNTKCNIHIKPDNSQQTLQFSHSTSSVVTYKFSQERSRQDLANMIIMHEYPFRMVEHEGFLKFVNNLQPQFKVMSEKTTREDCKNLVADLEIKIRIMIQETPGHLSYTTDLWTSNQTLGYMAVTCHFIDKDWNLQKLILSFKVISAPHTGIAISDMLFKCFNDWNVTLAITMDNATSNDAAIIDIKRKLREQNMLIANGSLLHQRCCAHILNLIVIDGLKIVKDITSKIRGCVKWIHSSQRRQQNFEDSVIGCCNELVSSRRPALDVITRWNSIYLMLISTIPYKSVFERLALRDASFEPLMPSDEEWKKANSLCNFLKPFYEITNIISGSTYSTANIFLPYLLKIKMHLERSAANSDLFFCQMVKPMQSKFDKYWADMGDMHCIASILDPRYKMSLLTHIYKQVMNLSYTEVENKLNYIKMRATTIYNSTYMQHAVTSNTITLENFFDIFYDEEMQDFDTFLANEANVENEMDEFEQYLADPLFPRSRSEPFDVLAWWKINAPRYPSVSLMARDILAIPITSVASEAIFSTAGRIIDDYRSNLTPETVEMLICGRDWIRIAKKQDWNDY